MENFSDFQVYVFILLEYAGMEMAMQIEILGPGARSIISTRLNKEIPSNKIHQSFP